MDIYQHIRETYSGDHWEPLTGILWEGDTPWQLLKYEHDTEYGGHWHRVVMIDRWIFSPSDLEAVEEVEEIFCREWVIPG